MTSLSITSSSMRLPDSGMRSCSFSCVFVVVAMVRLRSMSTDGDADHRYLPREDREGQHGSS